jgi:Ca2+-binding EF-hand superfamily protein
MTAPDPTPDLLTAKISTGFAHLDADGDGQLTEHDHVLMGQRAAASLGHPAGSPAEQRIIDAYLRIWRDLHLPHVPAGGTAITREQFLTSTRTLAADPDAAAATVGALARAFLAIADTDQDGQVGPAEFLTFQRGHFPGLAEAVADEAFRHLDRDGDGRLSADEFTDAVVEFWSSTDPDAPGNWWLGDPAQLS